ncbi:MAG: hypothetical protein WCF09_03005, partial [Gallionella sp.]
HGSQDHQKEYRYPRRHHKLMPDLHVNPRFDEQRIPDISKTVCQITAMIMPSSATYYALSEKCGSIMTAWDKQFK